MKYMISLRPFGRRLYHLWGRPRSPIRLIKDQDATVLIEFAAGLSFFMVLGFGGAEFINYVTTQTRISQLALTVADNASRSQTGTVLALPQMREIDINDIFKGAELQSSSIDFKLRGKVILSSLEVNGSGNQFIRWQRCFGNGPFTSSFGTPSSSLPSSGMGPSTNKIKAASGTAVMFVEILYNYDPILYASWMSPDTKRMQATAAFQIRDARDLDSGVTNPSPTATVSRCS